MSTALFYEIRTDLEIPNERLLRATKWRRLRTQMDDVRAGKAKNAVFIFPLKLPDDPEYEWKKVVGQCTTTVHNWAKTGELKKSNQQVHCATVERPDLGQVWVYAWIDHIDTP